MLKHLKLETLQNTPLITEPFPYLIVPGFLRSEGLAEIHRDYPQVTGPGSYPLDLLQYGPAFRELISELESEALRATIAEKFSMSLEGRPTLITARGHSQRRDGQIHTDTKSKLITVLLYLNPQWENAGGRLRLLRDADNLDNVIAEVPPTEGTLLVFKVSPNSWHGHKPFEGPRRVLQLNYVTDAEVVRKEIARHHFSAKFKKIKNLLGISDY
jgi:SM-20-related protein